MAEFETFKTNWPTDSFWPDYDHSILQRARASPDTGHSLFTFSSALA
jgi:hypothetical protein